MVLVPCFLQNEVILLSVLDATFEAASSLLKYVLKASFCSQRKTRTLTF